MKMSYTLIPTKQALKKKKKKKVILNAQNSHFYKVWEG